MAVFRSASPYDKLSRNARQAQNTEAEERAREIRLRAERKCGQMLSDVERQPGLRTDLTSRHDGDRSFTKQLSDSHITEKQARNWQKLAAVPDDLFEQALAEPNGSDLTSSHDGERLFSSERQRAGISAKVEGRQIIPPLMGGISQITNLPVTSRNRQEPTSSGALELL